LNIKKAKGIDMELTHLQLLEEEESIRKEQVSEYEYKTYWKHIYNVLKADARKAELKRINELEKDKEYELRRDAKRKL
jgi:hypothetical protein